MSINLSVPRDEHEMKPRISVVGVGGAGGNAVNNMIRSNLIGCEFLICNTDAQAMMQNLAERRIQLGISVTRGLGAGSRPDVGRAAAEEALDEIMQALHGSNMVFITAGMGGGTGTGAAPVIARAAREAGILTVGVVTKPFHFEGSHRMRLAEAGMLELQKYVDTLIIIPNQNLFRVANEKTTFADAFKMADDVLHSGVRGVTDLMIMPGLINLDFADIRAVMGEMGKAMMGTGEAEGDRRAIDAAEAAISNPLLEDVSMKGARGVLINITGGADMTLFEVDEAANRIREEVDPEANIIFGSTFDEKLAGRMRISVVATGIDVAVSAQRPLLSLVGDRDAPQPGSLGVAQMPAASVPGALPIAASALASPPVLPAMLSGGDSSEPTPAAAQAAESAALREGAYLVQRAVEPAIARPQVAPVAVSDAFAAAAMENGGRPVAKVKPRGPSLFERVTGVGRNRAPAAPAERAKVPAATATAQQPRLGALDPGDRLIGSKSEEDLLDIPAFLRRQAN
ncbi:MAG TPA: cell division protein FtsZ [Stellaceae bacterium]|nr:cell division protein FtsZ [Stellaceae bacterium]